MNPRTYYSGFINKIQKYGGLTLLVAGATSSLFNDRDQQRQLYQNDAQRPLVEVALIVAGSYYLGRARRDRELFGKIDDEFTSQ